MGKSKKELESESKEIIEALDESLEDNFNNDFDDTKELEEIGDISLNALEEAKSNAKVEELDIPLEEDAEEKIDLINEMENEISKPVKTKKKNQLVVWFSNLSGKKKALFITLIVLIIALLIGLIVGISMISKDEVKEVIEDKLPDVILEAENYRYENGILIFTHSSNNEVGRYECKNKDEKLCKIATTFDDDTFDKASMIDEDGKKVILNTPIYYDRYVFIFDNSKESDTEIIFYDIKENKEVSRYLGIKTYTDYSDYFVLKDTNNNEGAVKISASGLETLVPFKYNLVSLLDLDNDKPKYVITKKDNNSYLRNLKGEELTLATNQVITGANGSYIKTRDSLDKYHVYNYNMQEFDKDYSFDYIELLDQFIIGVYDSSLHVFDYSSHRMTSQEMKISNNNYAGIQTITNNKVSKLQKSFNYELHDKLLTIKTYEDDILGESHTYSINLVDGLVSIKLQLLEYLDGKLFFYQDIEKKNLIGTYECQNKNTTKEDSTELANCYVARESFMRETRGNDYEVDQSSKLGSIPVFNQKYAFIKDGDVINLVDLADSSVKAIYDIVDTSSYTETNEVTLSKETTVTFMARSKRTGKYGVVRINGQSLEGVISFDKSYLKKLGDYYVVQDENGFILVDKWGKSQYNDGGQTKEMEYQSSPIVDYRGKYIKTMQNNVFYLHSFDNSTHDSNSYNHITLDEKYYLAVRNNKVFLFSYDDEEDSNDKKYDYLTGKNASEGGLQLNNNNYYGEGVRSYIYTIEYDEKEKVDKIKIKIGDSTDTYGEEKVIKLKKLENNNEDEENTSSSSTNEDDNNGE